MNSENISHSKRCFHHTSVKKVHTFTGSLHCPVICYQVDASCSKEIKKNLVYHGNSIEIYDQTDYFFKSWISKQNILLGLSPDEGRV